MPDVPWHAHRDRLAAVAAVLGLGMGTLGKIARDISLHTQTEVAEVFEPGGEGRGGSSTMPHKRNPVAAAVVLAAATRIPGLVATMLARWCRRKSAAWAAGTPSGRRCPELVGAVRAGRCTT